MTFLILASGSPFRLALLREAGYSVEAVPSGIIEPDLKTFPDVETGLISLAHSKARAAAQSGQRGLILAADTVGLVAGQLLGKASDRAEAREMLKSLSGTEHDVLTGWCLLRTSDQLLLSGVERTAITMRSWTQGEMEAYLDSGEWIGKSGAYGLQRPWDPFVTHMSGSVSNVIGVPLERLHAVLTEFPGLTRPYQ